MSKEYPELFAVAKREGEIPEKEKEELKIEYLKKKMPRIDKSSVGDILFIGF